MNLIDRYVNEVGKRLLVLQGREDIEKELKSTLEDMLEDRAQKAGRPVDEAMEIELLKEYGSPEKVAAIYNPHPYLIGPHLFPTFLMVLKIAILGVVIGLLVVTGIQVVTETPVMGGDFVRIVGQGLGNILSTSVVAFGYVVLVFAVIERTVPDFSIKELDGEPWDPATLTREPDPDSIKRGELITEIVFTFIGLAILNLYPELLGMTFFADDRWIFIPIFSALFFNFLPWINLTLLADILLNMYLLRNAAWTNATRIAKILIEAASLALTIVIFRTPGILGFSSESLALSPFGPENAERVTFYVTKLFPLILIVVMIIQGIELAKAIYGFLRINYKTR